MTLRVPLVRSTPAARPATVMVSEDMVDSYEPTVDHALKQLAKLPGPAGRLTKELSMAPRNARLTPQAAYALHSLVNKGTKVSRHLAEAGKFAQTQTDFLFDRDPNLKLGRFHGILPPAFDYRHHRRTAKRMVQSYMAPSLGLVQKTDSVLDIGSSFGAVPKYLKKAGVKHVVGLEPFIGKFRDKIAADKQDQGKSISPEKKAELEKILPMTVEAYVEEHPDEKFSVVNISNFNTHHTSAASMFKASAALTAPGGKTLVGVCAVDPHLTGEGPDSLKAQLDEFFEDVEYHSFEGCEEFEEYGSVGGQLGYFECKVPRPPKDSAAPVVTAAP